MRDWLDARNPDFGYQLTSIRAPGPNLYLAETMQNNRFRVAGGIAGGLNRGPGCGNCARGGHGSPWPARARGRRPLSSTARRKCRSVSGGLDAADVGWPGRPQAGVPEV